MQGNKGKYAEGQFKIICDKYAVKAAFAYMRLPDTHGGSKVPTIADFQTVYGGTLRMVEIKETKFSDRLPYGNFDSAQVARLKRWSLAGAHSWVIIYHTEEKLYRLHPSYVFEGRDMTVGSWFFRDRSVNDTDSSGIGMTSKSLEEIFRILHGM